MGTGLKRYDSMRAEAKRLGPRRVNFLFHFSANNNSITQEMLTDAIENQFNPRDGNPHVVKSKFICADLKRRQDGTLDDVIITMEIVADISRYVYTDNPDTDYIDKEESMIE